MDKGAPDESLSFLTDRLLADSSRPSPMTSLTRRWPSSRVGVKARPPERLGPPVEDGPALARSTLAEAMREDRRGVCGIDDVGGEGVSLTACGRSRAGGRGGGDVGSATPAGEEEAEGGPAKGATTLVMSSSGIRASSVRAGDGGNDEGGGLGMAGRRGGDGQEGGGDGGGWLGAGQVGAWARPPGK